MDKNNHKPHINVDYFEDLTGEVSKPAAEPAQAIGERISTLRKEKGMSLDELSHLSGFDVDFLSDIEKSRVQPQLGTVIKLSKALDEAFSRILSDVGDQLYSISRKGDAKPVAGSTSRQGKKHLYTYKGLAPEVKGRHMEAVLVRLEEGRDEAVSVHQGEEFVYVLEGCVYVKLGDEEFELAPGDSIYYLSTIPHLLSAVSEKALILAVIYIG
ncbi:MAG: XRE family transcriptional regulator [Desulfobacterales bacterium]